MTTCMSFLWHYELLNRSSLLWAGAQTLEARLAWKVKQAPCCCEISWYSWKRIPIIFFWQCSVRMICRLLKASPPPPLHHWGWVFGWPAARLIAAWEVTGIFAMDLTWCSVVFSEMWLATCNGFDLVVSRFLWDMTGNFAMNLAWCSVFFSYAADDNVHEFFMTLWASE